VGVFFGKFSHCSNNNNNPQKNEKNEKEYNRKKKRWCKVYKGFGNKCAKSPYDEAPKKKQVQKLSYLDNEFLEITRTKAIS